MKVHWLSLLFIVETVVTIKDEDYCKIKCKQHQHTLCVYTKTATRANCPKWSSGLDREQRSEILDFHNHVRQKVAKGMQVAKRKLPPASNMRQLSWDQELEIIAQRWADQCHKSHHDKCRKTLDGASIGQNMAFQWGLSLNLTNLVDLWYSEAELLLPDTLRTFSARDRKYFKSIGHYTQMVWADTYSIGCGLAMKNKEVRLVCNYKAAGNTEGEPMYSAGPACSQCGSRTCSTQWPGLCL